MQRIVRVIGPRPRFLPSPQYETTREGALMLYIRTILRFFQDCLEALTDDDKTAEHRAHEARLAQKRWLEYLSG
jgi:hypothetical protein